MADQDGILVERARSGEESAFAALVLRHVVWAQCYAACLLEKTAAEAALTRAFHQAWQGLGKLRESQGFPGWFADILRAEIEALARQQASALRPLPALTDSEWMDPEQQDEAAFLSLNLDDRVAIALIQEACLDYDLAAEICHCSPALFARQLLRARQRWQQAREQRRQASLGAQA